MVPWEAALKTNVTTMPQCALDLRWGWSPDAFNPQQISARNEALIGVTRGNSRHWGEADVGLGSPLWLTYVGSHLTIIWSARHRGNRAGSDGIRRCRGTRPSSLVPWPPSNRPCRCVMYLQIRGRQTSQTTVPGSCLDGRLKEKKKKTFFNKENALWASGLKVKPLSHNNV